MPRVRPTIGDVARAAGVSKGTVSLAYSGKRPVADETRRRILEAAATLGWTPSESARALATSRAAAIGLVLARTPDVLAADSFFPRFISGCESVLSGAGMGLLLNVVTSAEAEEAVYRRHAAGRVDGVLLLDIRRDDPRPALMAELELPAVMLTGHRPSEAERHGLSAVYVEGAPAIRRLVGALVDAGHRHIAHVTGPLTMLHAIERREAFVTAVRDHGLDPTRVVEADFTAAAGHDATAALLDGPEPPTAIVYANDVMAIAGLSLARSRGLRVPEDLSLTGYDNTELSGHLSPALTSVDSDPYASGVRATQRLLADLLGDPPAAEHLDCVRVHERGSIGPAPTHPSIPAS
ncbi:LacI family DNA-binding transcriptional regulator [Brachybacterium sp. YJGR34]|uniref:LacI family DNA-binding transcriptional regulator n=1 Tax=Brachybacterium sp. YJGR34 TaxID=2059911 RepID=UPI000E0A1B2B|nr:LacI family DNA-binding transcriptional regulator [Brachybacterium sp. YJGR34]